MCFIVLYSSVAVATEQSSLASHSNVIRLFR
jgi:hypothetical protein